MASWDADGFRLGGRSRGTGPRATVKHRKLRRRIVGRGPVPRHASVLTETVRGLWAADGFRLGGRSRGTGPRATFQATFFVSNERSRGTGPRATVVAAFFSRNNLDKKRDIC